jgi:hypothetical protein
VNSKPLPLQSRESQGYTACYTWERGCLLRGLARGKTGGGVHANAECPAPADAMRVNTQEATLGNTIGNRPITRLPFEARNVVGLLSLQPRITYFGDPVNGGKSDQSNVVDGVD